MVCVLRRVSLLATLTLVVFAGPACSDQRGATQPDPDEVAVDDGPVIALLEESNFWPASIVKGRLTERRGCLLIEDAVAVFPVGTKWTPPSVSFRSGDSVYVDSRVRMGGGWFDLEGVTQESLPIMPVADVRECARLTGATQYAWAAPDGLL